MTWINSISSVVYGGFGASLGDSSQTSGLIHAVVPSAKYSYMAPVHLGSLPPLGVLLNQSNVKTVCER